MNEVDVYVQAATRSNTRRSYASALRHFEVEWGGFLPASADGVARYLAQHAEQLSIATLRHRLAALSHWHQDQGFADPTKTSLVRKTLKGILALHPAQPQQAVPLQIDQLTHAVAWLDTAILTCDSAERLRFTRNKALLLLGFWRGFRSDELISLEAQNVELVPGQGMICFFPRTKADRQLVGQHFKVPALSRLCPVAAYTAWTDLAEIENGPVFRGVSRWGHINAQGLHANSITPLLRSILEQAGLLSAGAFSSHSLRRGFANWANDNGWDVRSLMEYVGWRDMKSAMRYIDTADSFGKQRIEQGLSDDRESSVR
jgi:site-specific recombinase XerD